MTGELLQKKAASMNMALDGYCAYRKKTSDKDATCEPPKPLPLPQPDPVPEDAARRICVKNNCGAMALHWQLADLTTQFPITKETPDYWGGDTLCLDGLEIMAKRGDKLNCRVKRPAWQDCVGPLNYSGIPYDSRARKQANFQCDGWLTNGNCWFQGLSIYGEEEAATAAIDVIV